MPNPLSIAYCGPAPVPAGIWAAWNLDPVLIAALGAAALFAWRRGGDARGPLLGGIAVLFVAFVSPLCAMTSALFSARAVHHLVVIAFAAPLLALGLPDRLRPALPASFVAATAVLWAWHLPGFYTAALLHDWLYWAMQLTLLGTAVVFWRALFAAEASAALVTIAATIGQMGLLGALLTFAPDPLYPYHAVAPIAWGLLPIADQQLAGLIMWVPGNLPYALFALLVARRAWQRSEAAA